MIEQQHDDIRLLQFDRLSREPGLVHAVTTKPVNMAPHRGAGCEQSVEYRQRICEILGVSFDHLTAPSQVHAADSLPISDEDVGCGRFGRDGAVAYVDGLLTDKSDVPIVVLSADCPVIVLYDPTKPALGAVHASWRGTVAGAASHLVHMMHKTYACRPEDLLAAVCPSAGPKQYEVGEIVRRVASERLSNVDACFIERDNSLYLDLWTANRQQLLDAGIQSTNIEIAGVCSISDGRFWSHRRDGETAGRFAFVGALL